MPLYLLDRLPHLLSYPGSWMEDGKLDLGWLRRQGAAFLVANLAALPLTPGLDQTDIESYLAVNPPSTISSVPVI